MSSNKLNTSIHLERGRAGAVSLLTPRPTVILAHNMAPQINLD